MTLHRLSKAMMRLWKLQPISSSNVGAGSVVQNTWYTILDTTRKARVTSIGIRQNNDETNAKTLEVRATIDGVTIDGGTAAQDDNTWYYWYMNQLADEMFGSTSVYQTDGRYAVMQGHSIKLEVRCTDAVGTNQNIAWYVRHYLSERV